MSRQDSVDMISSSLLEAVSILLFFFMFEQAKGNKAAGCFCQGALSLIHFLVLQEAKFLIIDISNHGTFQGDVFQVGTHGGLAVSMFAPHLQSWGFDF